MLCRCAHKARRSIAFLLVLFDPRLTGHGLCSQQICIVYIHGGADVIHGLATHGACLLNTAAQDLPYYVGIVRKVVSSHSNGFEHGV